ncbi:hypothetical protein AbraIFM66950_005796, partial [Aspergillus brasiliensis]
MSAIPSVHINDTSPIEEQHQRDTSSSTSPTTRKSLHQNIFGKLRPLPFQYHWTVWYDRHTDAPTSGTTATADYDSRLYVLHEDVADIATFYR